MAISAVRVTDGKYSSMSTGSQCIGRDPELLVNTIGLVKND
jgi:hypothetical protein